MLTSTQWFIFNENEDQLEEEQEKGITNLFIYLRSLYNSFISVEIIGNTHETQRLNAFA
jgi:hypothetical protein